MDARKKELCNDLRTSLEKLDRAHTIASSGGPSDKRECERLRRHIMRLVAELEAF